MPIEMIAWYEGLPIKVLDNFSIDDIVLYLIYEDIDEPVRIDSTSARVKVNSTLITEEGINTFTIKYQIDSTNWLEDKFTVKGYTPKKHVDEEFQVVYIDIMGNRIDCTKDFVHLFTLNVTSKFTKLNITWNSFLTKVNELKQYGNYEVIAPKNSGLFHKYGTLWSVTCDNENSIRAALQKIFNEEEKEDEY